MVLLFLCSATIVALLLRKLLLGNEAGESPAPLYLRRSARTALAAGAVITLTPALPLIADSFRFVGDREAAGHFARFSVALFVFALPWAWLLVRSRRGHTRAAVALVLGSAIANGLLAGAMYLYELGKPAWLQSGIMLLLVPPMQMIVLTIGGAADQTRRRKASPESSTPANIGARGAAD